MWFRALALLQVCREPLRLPGARACERRANAEANRSVAPESEHLVRVTLQGVHLLNLQLQLCQVNATLVRKHGGLFAASPKADPP